jgi:broad specificity phosphatase PhoE
MTRSDCLGVHNIKEQEVGRQEWERYWSRIDGDGKITWVDPELTAVGIQQALELRDFWAKAIQNDGVCAPTSFYTSPLRRCLHTAQLTWSTILKHPQAKSIVVKEHLREIFGVHTCDKRGATSTIRHDYPQFVIPTDFAEKDTLWNPGYRETLDEHSRLWQEFLQELFATDDSTFVSLTTHSGATRALYLAIGHPDVWTAAGSVVPIVVRAQRVNTAWAPYV